MIDLDYVDMGLEEAVLANRNRLTSSTHIYVSCWDSDRDPWRIAYVFLRGGFDAEVIKGKFTFVSINESFFDKIEIQGRSILPGFIEIWHVADIDRLVEPQKFLLNYAAKDIPPKDANSWEDIAAWMNRNGISFGLFDSVEYLDGVITVSVSNDGSNKLCR